MKYIATISYGKDSVAMVDLLLRNNYQVDYIIYNETFAEFSLMYEYKKKIDEYFKSRYNKEVITLKPLTTFEEWCFGVIRDKKSKFYGAIRGVPSIAEPCYWRREAKVKPAEKWIKKNIKGKYKIYLGYTLDEIDRKQKDKNLLYPLIDDFKMKEIDCKKYLIEREMENPLYRYFNRTGCAFCPFQNERSFYQVYKYFKETWDYMKDIEKKLFWYKENGMKVKNCYWFAGNKICEDMEKEFRKADLQQNLFDFSDEPIRDCFCKI
jgi:3'-phosphoadenosine 5'-phosphosulfate sulfotransferase (PAPS reductase)/FAD synthetase